MGTTVLISLLTVAGIAAVIYIAYLTIKKIKELIQKRLERNRKSKVAFGETRKIVDENAKAILDSAPSMTMRDLEQYCEETPYFVVDYNEDTGEVSDYETIQTDGVEQKVNDLFSSTDGVILFD